MRKIIPNKGGIIPRTEYIQLLGLYDLFEKTYTRKDNAIFMCKKVIEFKKEHGKYPSRISENEHEQKMNRWMQSMRNAKKGNGTALFYPILEQMAINAGLPDMFTNIDREHLACSICHKLIEFKKEHGRSPIYNSNNLEEKKLANWLRTMRKAKKGIGNGTILYPAVEQMAIDAGFHNLFDTIDLENIAHEMCYKVIQFKQEHGKNPNVNSSNLEEKKLAKWINAMRSAKQGKGHYVFYPVLERMAIDAGFHNLFNIRDLETIACGMCQNVIEFKNQYNRYPSMISKNADEKKLGLWLRNFRGAKQNKGNCIFYPSLEQMAIDAGFNDMFNNIDRERISVETCQLIIKFKQDYGRYPSTDSKNVDERKLGIWLRNMRLTKKGTRNGILYQSVEQMAIDDELPNMFNVNWKDDLK